jgi:effector-binding domain-containing protein
MKYIIAALVVIAGVAGLRGSGFACCGCEKGEQPAGGAESQVADHAHAVDAAGAPATPIAASGAAARGLNPQHVNFAGQAFASLEGKAAGTAALMGELMGAAGQQGLMGPDSHVWSVYPDVMAKGYSPETVVYASVTVADDATAAAPLMRYDAAPGRYLKAQHWGDYAGLEATYMSLFAWAEGEGIEFATDRPVLENYVTDPTTAAVEDWLTEIYIPLAD